MKAIGMTDVGLKRLNNEDHFIIDEKSNLVIVADGMGGYEAGEVASKLSSTFIQEKINDLMTEDSFDFVKEISDILKKANEEVLNYAKTHSNCKGMGTTIVIFHMKDGVVNLASVGDSRCYGIKEGHIEQITEDHSLVAELVKMGTITPAEAKNHPASNVITSAIGVEDSYDVCFKNIPSHTYDFYLVCTDGLTNMLNDLEIERVIQNTPRIELPNRLIEMANANGGKDNITVVCIEN